MQTACNLKMKMLAYWEVVPGRMVDNMVLHLFFNIGKVVNKEMQKEIIVEVMGPQGKGLERMLEGRLKKYRSGDEAMNNL